ncbi:MAG: polysaccharide deacetylase family protein [Candidatus Saccharicenans sp.]|nr:MAG: polysaccharide deacetylase family protein [Candidatus Aminicenantes bacterium]HEK86828.1 polysaccharide deacetylase family protein [Candidatus Aminicenantes bacterium]
MKFKIGLVISGVSFLLTIFFFLIFKIVFPGLKIALSYQLIFFLFLAGALSWGVFDHKSPLFGHNFWRGSKKQPVMSLTFDDGPTEPYTSAILRILNQYRVKATFFVLGQKVELYPDSLKKIAADGHEIGNHGYSHEVLPLKSPAKIRSEIKKTEKLIISLSGQKPELFRAPHGWKGPWLKKTVQKSGYELVSWTTGVWDTDRPGEQVIINRSLKAFKNGAILLFHDGRGLEKNPDCHQLVAALPVIIESALSQGYRLETISRLIEISRLKLGSHLE